MTPLRFSDFTARIKLGGAIMSDPVANRVYKMNDVPLDPDQENVEGYVPQTMTRTGSQEANAFFLMQISDRAPIILMTDLDGTGSRFGKTVEETSLAPGYLSSLVRMNSTNGRSAAYAITGRSEPDARALLSINGELQVPLIYSHGTGVVMPTGERGQITFTEAEEYFLNRAFKLASDIEATHPDMQVQTKQSGIDVKDTTGVHIADIREAFQRLVHESPQLEGKPVFGVHDEGDLETSIRYDVVDKARAIEAFILQQHQAHPGALLVFAADSFGKGGTDRAAAEFVQKQGGIVIQVLNGRASSLPEPDDRFRADIVLPNPEALALMMDYISHQQVRAFRPKSDPSPQQRHV